MEGYVHGTPKVLEGAERPMLNRKYFSQSSDLADPGRPVAGPEEKRLWLAAGGCSAVSSCCQAPASGGFTEALVTGGSLEADFPLPRQFNKSRSMLRLAEIALITPYEHQSPPPRLPSTIMTAAPLPIEALPAWASLYGVGFFNVELKTISGKGIGLAATQRLSLAAGHEGAFDDAPLLKVPRDLVLSSEAVERYAKIDHNFGQLLDAAGHRVSCNYQ